MAVVSENIGFNFNVSIILLYLFPLLKHASSYRNFHDFVARGF